MRPDGMSFFYRLPVRISIALTRGPAMPPDTLWTNFLRRLDRGDFTNVRRRVVDLNTGLSVLGAVFGDGVKLAALAR